MITASIGQLIQEGDVNALGEAVNALSPFEVADLITRQTEEAQTLIFSVLSPNNALETFEFLPFRIQEHLLRNLPETKAAEILKDLSPDDRTSFLQELPRNVIDELVKLLPHDERILTLTLLGYPEGSIGRLMTPDYLAIMLDWTIEEVLEHVRQYGHDSETLEIMYVVDEEGHLIDDIRLRDFLFVPKDFKVRDIADYHFVALSVYDDDAAAIEAFERYDRAALPVIDEENILLGIVTVDDVIKLSSRETTEAIQKMGGVEALDEPYMQTPFLELMRKRASWLIILFLGELLTATAMAYFEEELAKAVVLALFLPLIISSGGNAGSQASTLIIRALALGEVKITDWWRVMKREIFSGLFLGAILGSIGFIRIVMWSLILGSYGEHWILLGITVSLALICVVLWGSLSGALLPLLLSRCGLDPATSSAPCVATIVDVTGVVIYFLVAITILRGTLL